MLQRKQTIWMLLAVIMAAVLPMLTTEIKLAGSMPTLHPVCGLAALLGVISIFSFKNRKRQILLNKLSIFLNVLLIGLLAYWKLSVSGGNPFPKKGIELIFPLIALVSLFLANRGIHKDEQLVKSVDRFR